jgi:aminoglycoside phosphotransferase (APT) family kinase protein
MALKIGRAMGSIPASGLAPTLRFDGLEQLRCTEKYMRELAKMLPDCANRLEQLWEALTMIHRKTTERALKPLHGAPHAHQWLVAEDRLGLVDFDRICLGDPELDAATFIAEMDFEDHETVPVVEINGLFLEAYQSAAGVLDNNLLQAYRAHKRLAKALKAARALRVDGDVKAMRHIEFACEALSAIAP